MPSKTALDAARVNAFLLDPESIVLITDRKDPLYDARIELPLDEALVQSIDKHGVKKAIIVRKDGDKVVKVDGLRRILHAREVNKRRKKDGREPLKIKAMVERGNDADVLETMIIANRFAEVDSPMEDAALLKRYLDLGRTEEEAAVTFGKKLAWVKQALSLLDCAAKVQSAVQAGQISVTAASQLAKLERKDQVEKLDELLADGTKATVRKVSRVVRKKKTDGPIPPTRKMIDAAITKTAFRADSIRAMRGLATKEETVVAALKWVLTGADETGLGLADEAPEEARAGLAKVLNG